MRSTRARVLGWFLLIVTVALAVNLLAVQELLHARVRSDVETEVSHEALKFREYADRAVGEGTGKEVASVRALLRRYLSDAVPENDEALFSVVDGQAADRTRNQVPVRLDTRADVIAVAASADRPIIRTLLTREGDATYAVVPVVTDRATSPQAALVIVEYTTQKAAEARAVVRLIAVASGIALLLAAAISWFVAGRILAPLRQVLRTAEAIGESDLTRRIDIDPDSRDDVALLAQTFNGMLDRLESSFHTQRAFLDDAAHELRTPLTVIRGHLELMGEDPSERAETTALLLDEIGRMNRMVDELLLLAAAERPDFLTLEAVDLTDLVLGVVSRSSALATRHWIVSETAQANVLADRQRLTQALMQLVSNAVRVTRDGEPISIGSRLEDGWVTLWVADTGPGVPKQQTESVFDRFNRGSGRSGGGTGLGLAIVSSIALAHRGEATVADTPGGGATFSIGFPDRSPASQRDAQARTEGSAPPSVHATGSGPGSTAPTRSDPERPRRFVDEKPYVNPARFGP